MNSFTTNRFSDAFMNAQEQVSGAIDTTDYSAHITGHAPSPPSPDIQRISGSDFIEIPRDILPSYIGQIVLVINQRQRVFSPSIITADSGGDYHITMLDQPYEPKLGLTPGIHFGLSVKAQTQVKGFGGHTKKQGFEAGHFSAVLIGARVATIGQGLIANGDTTTHTVLDVGIAESMSQAELLRIPYRTKKILNEELPKISAFWHESLQTEDGIASGNYPGAVQLMMGAGIAALGQKGFDQARYLVDKATMGA